MTVLHQNISYRVMVGMLTVMLLGISGCGSLLGGGTYNKFWNPQEKCRAVHLWVAKIESEIPKGYEYKINKPGSYGTGDYVNVRLNAFKDEYFVPMFGTPVDQMSDREAEGIRLKVRNGNNCYQETVYRETVHYYTNEP